jgi:hypothetical protein
MTPKMIIDLAQKLTPEETQRFLKNIKVDPVSGCWNWTGELSSSGYGKFFYNGKKHKVHRLMYSLFTGNIPEYSGDNRLELDHIVCDNKACCNPLHVKLVSHSENMKRTRKEFCERGHPMSEARVVKQTGERICRVCERMRCKKYRDSHASSNREQD